MTKSGRRMDQSEAWRIVRRLPRRAAPDGAGEIRPNSLRVIPSSRVREAGVALEDVQDAAGHANPRTTRRYDRGRHSLDRHASYAMVYLRLIVFAGPRTCARTLLGADC